LGPSRDVTKTKLDHVPAGLADDVVMVIFQLAELVPDGRPTDDLKENTGGFEKIERTIDRRQSDAFSTLQKTLVDFSGTQGSRRLRKRLVDEEPRKAKAKPLLSEQVFQKPFCFHKVKVGLKNFSIRKSNIFSDLSSAGLLRMQSLSCSRKYIGSRGWAIHPERLSGGSFSW
jgi:hypothetical protein